jgi:hypothetical protein
MSNKKHLFIIPYRDRESQLKRFIKETVPLFKKHFAEFKVLVVEQSKEKELFNRGKLLNVGFQENKDKYDYFINHDIDVYPKENAIKEFYLKEFENGILGIYSSYRRTLGGNIKYLKNDFELINGYPNNYWGWGVEDIALYNRVNFYKIPIEYCVLVGKKCYEKNINKYFNLPEDADDRVKHRFCKKRTFEYHAFHRLSKDEKHKHIMSSGLSNLKYKIIEKKVLSDNVELIKVKI